MFAFRFRGLPVPVVLMISLVLASVTMLAQNGQAQDASPSSAASGSSANESLTPGDSSQPSAASSTVQPPVVRAAGQASPLSIVAGQVLVGNLALSSIQLDETWNQLNLLNPANTTPTTTSTAPTVSTGLLMDIAYDRQFRTTRLSFQYVPNLYVVNGHLFKSFNNQNVNFNVGFQVRPRVFLTIGDSFLFNGSQDLAANQYFTADFVTQTVVQNAFLNIAGYYLNDQLHGELLYYLSPRTKLTLSTRYSYAKTAVSPNSLAAEAAAAANIPPISIDRDAGAGIAVDHQLTSTKTIGVYYSFDRSYYNQIFATTYFNTVGLHYSQLVRPTLSFAASVGASGAYSKSQPSSATVVGNLSLIKTYPKTQLAGAYSRSYGGGGFVSAGYSDRVDLSYARQMARRWTAGVSGAYLRGTTITTFTGSYASLNTSFLLTRTISWFATYGLAREVGVQTPFFPGTHSYVTTGFRWNPSRVRIGTEPSLNPPQSHP